MFLGRDQSWAPTPLQFESPVVLLPANSAERRGHPGKGLCSSPSVRSSQHCRCWRFHCRQHFRCFWLSCGSAEWCQCRPEATGVEYDVTHYPRAPLVLQILSGHLPDAAVPAWPWLHLPNCCCGTACSSTCSID